MDNMQIKIAAETNIGLRRSNNEDRFAICPSLAAPTGRLNVPKYRYPTRLTVP